MATTPDWEDLSQSTVSGTATIESAITSITWLTDSTLLLGSRGNAELQIWTTHHSEGGPSPQQTSCARPGTYDLAAALPPPLSQHVPKKRGEAVFII